jgi:hypothetical protein
MIFTGNSICPDFGTSMRGLAYDPISDIYFAGTWNNSGFIVAFDSTGAIVGGPFGTGWSTGGLAYNLSTGHLIAVANTTDMLDIAIFDVTDPSYPLLYALPSGLGGNQGGAAFCENLWVTNQSTKEIVEIDIGETGVCPPVIGIPWLTEAPDNGTIPNGKGSMMIDLIADPYPKQTGGANLGCNFATLKMPDNTPYPGPHTMGISFTVMFHDTTSNPLADFIHALPGAGVTQGCGGGDFCPADSITRAQMAKWLLKAKYGADYNPPPASGLIFGDVSSETFAADYIEQLFNMGVVAGCGGGNYCPDAPVTREQMAVYQLVTYEYGSGWTPWTTCEGIFGDVASGGFCPFIEELYCRGIVTGCGGGNYCPGTAVNRAIMSVFTDATFEIPLCSTGEPPALTPPVNPLCEGRTK